MLVFCLYAVSSNMNCLYLNQAGLFQNYQPSLVSKCTTYAAMHFEMCGYNLQAGHNIDKIHNIKNVDHCGGKPEQAVSALQKQVGWLPWLYIM